METQIIPGFDLIGVSIRTSNENNLAATDIPALWGRFFSEKIDQKIPAKIGDAFYCVYTNYEKDYTRPYTVILGCKVKDLGSIPEGMIGITLEDAKYVKFEAKGDLTKNIIAETWFRIWDTKLDRSYFADFEVYDERSSDMSDATVDIFIGVE